VLIPPMPSADATEKHFRLTDELRAIRLTMLTLSILSAVLLLSVAGEKIALRGLGLDVFSISKSNLIAALHVLLLCSTLHFLSIYWREKRERVLTDSLQTGSRNFVATIGANLNELHRAMYDIRQINGKIDALLPDLKSYFDTLTTTYSKGDTVARHLGELTAKLQELHDRVPKAISEIGTSYSSYKVVLRFLPYWHVMRAWLNFWSLYFWDLIVPVLFSISILVAMIGHYEVRATWADILTKLFAPVFGAAACIRLVCV
jgi:hypothetical protein